MFTELKAAIYWRNFWRHLLLVISVHVTASNQEERTARQNSVVLGAWNINEN